MFNKKKWQQKLINILNRSKTMKSNSIMMLSLYKEGTTWAFDDATFGITREPFVMGMSEIISSYLPEKAKTCTIYFSHNAFPNCEKLNLIEEQANGGVYKVESTGMMGWLCPVTRIYMQGIPQNIYFQVKP